MDSDESDGEFGQDWDNLETITKFDGVRSRDELASLTRASTELVSNGLRSRLSSHASTPVSLLVESLVQQLCALLESDPSRSKDLYKTICERLHAVNLIDETYAMGEFETMRSQYQKALYQLVSIARGQHLPVVALENVWPLQPDAGLEWSRYHREFTELSFIAGGAFGKVFQARNNLDGIVYAVKKVTIRSTTIKNVLVHLAEVKTLASLNHINIVPYKAAWLEPLLARGEKRGSDVPDGRTGPATGFSTFDDEDDDDDEEDESTSSDEEEESVDEMISTRFSFSYQAAMVESKSHRRRRRSTLNDSLKRPEPTVEEDDNDDFSIRFEYSNGETNSNGRDEHSSGNKNQLAELEEARGRSVISVEETQPHVKLKWATLYIQMTLCHLTLREWLDDRNRFGCFDKFYHNFVHNPRKDRVTSAVPKNSFCRSSSLVEYAPESVPITARNEPSPSQVHNSAQHLDVVTDVMHQLLNGLTYIHSRGIVHHDIKPSNIFVSLNDHDQTISIQLGDFGLACPLQSSHTGAGFGTPLYAAPEQLEGRCDPKSDIYSLGIILLELLMSFDTDMERAAMIRQVRKGEFPPELDPEFSDLLKQLLSVRPTKRPDTFALTQAVNCMKLNRDKVISHLKKSLSEQEEHIQNLQTRIDEQSRQQEESFESFNRLEISHSETLIVKEQELICKTMEIESKNQQLRFKELELQSKDEEIERLKGLLRNYQEKIGDSSPEIDECATNGKASFD
ncbi:eukaryotic translation initiation factor 2-alpha kinase 1-like [Uranotaenia lowii]|uniref:eukaryotic translation initiation factor 2-alpha kinase 1-like n=1 Tax=Uranotaenia lowii TaxID=190385 RepID=UPI00247AA253|nr:eukaryotic translation initiation factor 2-alpha kinase 1-like [Uranotaenia lowii]